MFLNAIKTTILSIYVPQIEGIVILRGKKIYQTGKEIYLAGGDEEEAPRKLLST